MIGIAYMATNSPASAGRPSGYRVGWRNDGSQRKARCEWQFGQDEVSGPAYSESRERYRTDSELRDDPEV